MTTTELTGAEDVAWDLSDLYESGDDPRLDADVQEAEEAAAAFRDRYYGKVAGLSAAELAGALDTQLLFCGLEIADLEDEAAEALLAADELEHWRHWLRSVRKFRPYLLTEPEEKIFTEKAVSGVSAWARLYEELLGALRVQLDGAEISFEEAMAKLYSGDRDERRRASDAVTVALAPGLAP